MSTSTTTRDLDDGARMALLVSEEDGRFLVAALPPRTRAPLEKPNDVRSTTFLPPLGGERDDAFLADVELERDVVVPLDRTMVEEGV